MAKRSRFAAALGSAQMTTAALSIALVTGPRRACRRHDDLERREREPQAIYVEGVVVIPILPGLNLDGVVARDGHRLSAFVNRAPEHTVESTEASLSHMSLVIHPGAAPDSTAVMPSGMRWPTWRTGQATRGQRSSRTHWSSCRRSSATTVVVSAGTYSSAFYDYCLLSLTVSVTIRTSADRSTRVPAIRSVWLPMRSWRHAP